MTSTLPPLVQATSGAIGSAIGNAIVFPLDLATTRMQHAGSNARKLSVISTLSLIIRKHGYRRLYRGLSADTLSTVLSSFFYFLIYTSLEKAVHKWRARRTIMVASPAGLGGSRKQVATLPAATPVFVGTIAGILSKRLSLPASAICVRHQLADDDETISDTLAKMQREKGFLGLFHVSSAAIPLALLPALTLYFHERLLNLLPAESRSHPSGGITFFFGALSNALATIPLYPLMLAKSRSLSGKEQSLGRIMQEEGVEGLYKGVQAQLLKGVVQQGVMMLIKQRVEEMVVTMYK